MACAVEAATGSKTIFVVPCLVKLRLEGRGRTRGRIIQGRMVRPVFLEGNGFVTRGGMCELEFSVHAALGDDKVMLSFYDCSVEEA